MNGWLQRRGISSVISNRQAIIGSGSRPILQKLASLLVSISLTIATGETITAAKYQYDRGYMNTDTLRDQVADNLALRVMRVLSFVVLWLAQVQTLIRLFPRHKEKLIIKWIGFVLILLDLIFGCLNAFLANTFRERPRSFQDAIPALSYLFELALSLLYAAWVFYYVMTKRRYAFFHPKMPSISIVALLSSVSILIPVVFFVADLSQPNVDGWGDYFRWVGAAAASIVVWEWVERIEALEREMKKDGILGREIYDGDEMLDITHNDFSPGSRRSLKVPKKAASTHDRIGTLLTSWLPLSRTRPGSGTREQPRESHSKWAFNNFGSKSVVEGNNKDSWTSSSSVNPPQRAASPVDRTSAGSVESTLYVVRYHQTTTTPPPNLIISQVDVPDATQDTSNPGDEIAITNEHNDAPVSHELEKDSPPNTSVSKPRRASQQLLSLAAKPFRSSRKSPPIEIKKAMLQSGVVNHKEHSEPLARLGIRRAFDVLIGGDSAGDRSRRSSKTVVSLEPTIIPAPPRGHTWSPDIHRHSPITYPLTRDSSLDSGNDRGRARHSGRVVSGLAEPYIEETDYAPQPVGRINESDLTRHHGRPSVESSSKSPSQDGPGETG